jgi:Flp pilus assembly protein TadD
MLNTYVEARVAEALGAEQRAVENYGAALAADPDNTMLAARALSQGISAGDWRLALNAARSLERAGKIAPDARFLLLVDAVKRKDWARARRLADDVAKDEIFSFMAPVAQAWIARGSRKGDPLAVLGTGDSDPLALPFVNQHRPLLLMAAGREKEALVLLAKLTEGGDGREWRIRMSAASTLLRDRKREEALGLLAGDLEPLIVARKLVEDRKPLRAEIATAPQGMAEFLLALSLDLRQQGINSLALSFARLATFLAPEDAEIQLVTGELLADREQQSAISILGEVPSDSPFAEAALDTRIKLLTQRGEHETALNQALAAARAPGSTAADWTRLGGLFGDIGRHSDAADAYGQAIQAARRGAGAGREPEWLLWLLHGGALEQADRWNEAKAALEQAYALAPEQPLVLNYLGYAQIERRENIAAASGLITKASDLQPNSPQITDSLGWARYLLGDVNGAVDLLEKAVQGDPNDPAISEHLGDAYYSAGRHFEARYAWQAALISAEDGDSKRIRAKIESGLRPELASP